MYATFGQLKKSNSTDFPPADMKISIAKSTFDLTKDPENAWALVEIVINWVDKNFEQSKGKANNIPISALQLYCANHYYCHVRELGHRGFLKATADKAGEIWPFVLAGLLNMKANAHANIFQEMADWVSNNIDDAVEIDDENNNFTALLTLDAKFELANMNIPFCVLAANWIEKWENIEILPDETFLKER